jgi:hypothetical protein
MARPDGREPKSGSNAGWIAWVIGAGLLAIIALLVIGFFVMDAVIGRQ